MSTGQNNINRKKYPSDISKNGWKQLKSYYPLQNQILKQAVEYWLGKK